jgi:Spy/CpxP family protein refolding chaperone
MGPDPVGEAVFPPELILRHAQAIGLSAEQRAFVREQVRQAQQRFLDLQFQLEDARDALVGVLQQNQVNEAQALGQLERILDFERQIKTAQITLMIRLKNKLTPEQQARLRELRGGYAETPPPSPY